jgi:phosphoadenosine phosphosulfate reductase family protein
VIVGARADEEGSRSKEQYFSDRTVQSQWDVGDQPPELWNQFKTEFAPGTHLRIHPLLDWTELTGVNSDARNVDDIIAADGEVRQHRRRAGDAPARRVHVGPNVRPKAG